MKLALVLLLLLAGCATTVGQVPLKKLRTEQSLETQKKTAGCFVWLPEYGELTLMTFETCALVVPETRK